MAGTSLRTTIPPLHLHDRCHSALLLHGPSTCRFVPTRKELHHPRLTTRTPSVRSNASMSYQMETSGTSFYELLEVPKDVSFEEVKRAYRRLALRYHPDVSPPDLVEQNALKFMEVQEAYQILSDPRRREVYDSGLRLGVVSATTSGRWQFNEELYERSNWKRQWQDQLEELERQSMTRGRESYSGLNSDISWGTKMRQRSAESTVL